MKHILHVVFSYDAVPPLPGVRYHAATPFSGKVGFRVCSLQSRAQPPLSHSTSRGRHPRTCHLLRTTQRELLARTYYGVLITVSYLGKYVSYILRIFHATLVVGVPVRAHKVGTVTARAIASEPPGPPALQSSVNSVKRRGSVPRERTLEKSCRQPLGGTSPNAGFVSASSAHLYGGAHDYLFRKQAQRTKTIRNVQLQLIWSI